MVIEYVQTTYIVNENEGPVEVCVSAYPVDLRNDIDIIDRLRVYNIYRNDNIEIFVEAFDFIHSIYIPSGAALASE